MRDQCLIRPLPAHGPFAHGVRALPPRDVLPPRRPAVLCRPPIWGLLFFHCMFLYMHKELHLDLGMIVKGSPPDDISKVTTTLLVFFLVYYGGQCYKRYYDMYTACMNMAGDVQCWVGLARVYFPQATPDILWNLSRHMVASVYFLYFELGGLASDGGRVITEAEWSVLFRSSLISQSERKVLEKYRGSRFFLMQSWALRLAADQMAKAEVKAPGAEKEGIRELEKHALSLRANGGSISNLLKQPVPFPMYHTLMLMMSVNLLITSCAPRPFAHHLCGGAPAGSRSSAHRMRTPTPMQTPWWCTRAASRAAAHAIARAAARAAAHAAEHAAEHAAAHAALSSPALTVPFPAVAPPGMR